MFGKYATPSAIVAVDEEGDSCKVCKFHFQNGKGQFTQHTSSAIGVTSVL